MKPIAFTLVVVASLAVLSPGWSEEGPAVDVVKALRGELTAVRKELRAAVEEATAATVARGSAEMKARKGNPDLQALGKEIEDVRRELRELIEADPALAEVGEKLAALRQEFTTRNTMKDRLGRQLAEAKARGARAVEGGGEEVRQIEAAIVKNLDRMKEIEKAAEALRLTKEQARRAREAGDEASMALARSLAEKREQFNRLLAEVPDVAEAREKEQSLRARANDLQKRMRSLEQKLSAAED